MALIKIKKSGKAFEVSSGSNLMKSVLAAEVPVASSCHGDGVCGKCRMIIISGGENLSRQNETELFLRDKFELRPEIRISCQSEVLGDVEVDTTYW